MSKFRELKEKIRQAKDRVIEPFLVNKIQSYKNLFSGEGTKKDADIVLADLIQTFNVNESSFKANLNVEQIALRTTIKEPVLRIKNFIEYSDEDVQKLINNINKNRKN